MDTRDWLIIAFIVLTFAQCVYIWYQHADRLKLRATLAKRDATITEQAGSITELEAKVAERTQDAIAFGQKLFRLQRANREREYEHGRG